MWEPATQQKNNTKRNSSTARIIAFRFLPIQVPESSGSSRQLEVYVRKLPAGVHREGRVREGRGRGPQRHAAPTGWRKYSALLASIGLSWLSIGLSLWKKSPTRSPNGPKRVSKSEKKVSKVHFYSGLGSSVKKGLKSDPPDLRQVGSRLGAVAFFTFSLCLQKGIKKAPKSSQNGCPGLSKGPQSRQNDPQSHHNGSPMCRSRHFGFQNGAQSH